MAFRFNKRKKQEKQEHLADREEVILFADQEEHTTLADRADREEATVDIDV